MSSEAAIQVRNISKCYMLYEQPHDRLKQAILPRFHRRMGREPRQYGREFWALRDISFDVRKGETVGIVGRNGSGKSTLLQIICGTMAPTSGVVSTSGRIAALLELGAGFNPEFTGRENVYLNASVLGLSRKEIDARFASIQAFADIGDFIEQPIKTYSSGMAVRLAFAVIAHVDADILIIDEALAVGDAFFVQKCMRFLRSFMERGTVLFVSHDTSAVVSLCRRALWIEGGLIKSDGSPRVVAEEYLQDTARALYGEGIRLVPTAEDTNALLDANVDLKIDHATAVRSINNLQGSTGWRTGLAEITSVTLTRADLQPVALFKGGERVCLTITAKALADLEAPIIGFLVKDRLGQILFGENTLPVTDLSPREVRNGQSFAAQFVFRLPLLPNGQYPVMISVANGNLINNVQHHYLHEAIILSVASETVRWGLVGIPFEKVTLTCQD